MTRKPHAVPKTETMSASALGFGLLFSAICLIGAAMLGAAFMFGWQLVARLAGACS